MPLAESRDAQAAHDELCFGCGLANLFGLQLELATGSDGVVSGRFFVKQDHQGPAGVAHAGVLAAALEEAMALAVERERQARPVRLELELVGSAPIGTFVALSARVCRRDGRRSFTDGQLSDASGARVAQARGVFAAARE